MSNWLYDENGKMRKGLYTVYPEEIAKLAAQIDAELTLPREPHLNVPGENRHRVPMVKSRFAKCVFIQPGDKIRVHPHYAIAAKFDGWLTVVRAVMNPIMGLDVLAQAQDGTGGFVSPHMIVEWRCSDLATMDPRQPGWRP